MDHAASLTANAFRAAQLPRILTIEDLADALRVSPDTARRYCATGLIPARKLGRRWLVVRDELIFELRPNVIPCADCARALPENALVRTPGGMLVCRPCAARLKA